MNENALWLKRWWKHDHFWPIIQMSPVCSPEKVAIWNSFLPQQHSSSDTALSMSESFLNMMNLSLSSLQETAVAPAVDLNHPCSLLVLLNWLPIHLLFSSQFAQVIQTQIPQNKSEGLFWGERLLAASHSKAGKKASKVNPNQRSCPSLEKKKMLTWG